MAEFLETFNKPLPRGQKYNWAQWMRPGNTVRLVRGIDFDQDKNIKNLRTRVHQVAKDYGLKADSYIEQVMKDGLDEPVDALVFHLERSNFGPVQRSWMDPEEITPAAVPVKPSLKEVLGK